jgi:hypothetical protein
MAILARPISARNAGFPCKSEAHNAGFRGSLGNTDGQIEALRRAFGQYRPK